MFNILYSIFYLFNIQSIQFNSIILYSIFKFSLQYNSNLSMFVVQYVYSTESILIILILILSIYVFFFIFTVRRWTRTAPFTRSGQAFKRMQTSLHRQMQPMSTPCHCCPSWRFSEHLAANVFPGQ